MGSVDRLSWHGGARSRQLAWLSGTAVHAGLILRPISGEGVAAAGSPDLSKLEVSLTLANKFEGLETDAGDISAQSLLLRWVRQPRPVTRPLHRLPVLRAALPAASLALPSPGLCVPLGLCSVLRLMAGGDLGHW